MFGAIEMEIGVLNQQREEGRELQCLKLLKWRQELLNQQHGEGRATKHQKPYQEANVVNAFKREIIVYIKIMVYIIGIVSNF